MFIASNVDDACLVFLFSKVNANAISALLASLDIHPILNRLTVFLPPYKSDPKEIRDEVKNYKKIIFAASVFSSQLDAYIDAIKKFKDEFKDRETIAIAGGPHPMGDPLSLLINGFDAVCLGEGEITFPEFILWFLQDNENLDQVPGIAYLDTNMNLVKTKKPPRIDLDRYPPFSVRHGLYRPIEITRGCAWKCRFCQIRSKGNNPVRHRSPDIVRKYAKIIDERFRQKGTDIRFISPNALSYGSPDGKTLRLDKVKEMLVKVREVIGESGKIFFGSFPSEVRPETITGESVKLLKEYSNSRRIIVGGQSGSKKVLEMAARGHTPEDTIRAVKLLIQNGFDVDVDIIFGLPGEEEEDIEQTIDHMKELIGLGATIHSHTFMPLVGTPFASAPAGKVDRKYQDIIAKLQGKKLLKGQHARQEMLAERMAETRKMIKEFRKKLANRN